MNTPKGTVYGGTAVEDPDGASQDTLSKMSEAPTGTVTLVFTDIQGSTALWERFGDGFRPILELHAIHMFVEGR